MTARQLLRKLFPPMLATLASAPPADETGWTCEWKYDGFRAVGAVSDATAALLSRNELDMADRFPRSFAALSKLKREIVVDGEIIVRDEKGVPRFQHLQEGNGREEFVVFDLLWLDGEDLRSKPYLERRAILEKTLRKLPAGMRLSEIIGAPAGEALAKAKEGGWEGIILKRNASRYEGRRSKDWLKLKAQNQQEFAIVGWQPSTASEQDIGSLHLGYFDSDGVFRYAGKVGTGFSAKLRRSLREELGKDVVERAPVVDAPRIRTATWVRPRLIAQVSFTEWTRDGRLRHPSFLGLREDKTPQEVVREEPYKPRGGASKGTRSAKKSTTPTADGPSRVKLTSPDRVLYPRDGITKADVLTYYEAMAEPMIRALEGRPLALEHWNQGIAAPPWFQQNIGREGASWMSYIDTPTRTSRRSVRHLEIDRVDTLRWLAQMSVLTIHMWAARRESLEYADWIVFDLDPAKGKGIEQAIEAALIMRKLLDELELPSVPKTSGKRGIHVFVPLAPGQTHEEAGDWACSIAAAVSAQVPWMTVERSLSQRKGRLYLDCGQNAYGKTVVAPYSLRGIDGAPVSAPLHWSEVTKRLDPSRYNLRTMPERLAKEGDLFATLLGNGVRLPKLG